jgi:hypothetical protein
MIRLWCILGVVLVGIALFAPSIRPLRGMTGWGLPRTKPPSPAEQGRADAERDIKRGLVRLKMFGKTDESITLYRQLLKDRLKVDMEIGGCTGTREFFETVDGYDEAMRREIAKRFGPTALADLSREAEDRWAKGER